MRYRSSGKQSIQQKKEKRGSGLVQTFVSLFRARKENILPCAEICATSFVFNKDFKMYLLAVALTGIRTDSSVYAKQVRVLIEYYSN